MNDETPSLSVGGYLFYTEKDAQIAREEQQKIEYLEARIDYSEPEKIRYIYEKTIRERLFKTPVGWKYLEKLHDYLLAQPEIAPESVIDIPLYMTFEGEIREQGNPARERVIPSKKRNRDKEKERFVLSVVLNVLLAAAIACMFYISFVSEHPTILNYERALVGKYADWEQELTEREEAIREKELELKIN